MQPYINQTNQRFVQPRTQRELAYEQFAHSPPLPDQQEVPLTAAFVAMEGADEKTSGLDRAIAICVRLLPFSLIWLVLTVGVVWLFHLSDSVGFLLFAGLTAATYWRMDRQEYEFSRHGIERHKIDTAARLTMLQMKHNQELRREVLKAHLKILVEGDVHDRQALEVPQRPVRQLIQRD